MSISFISDEKVDTILLVIISYIQAADKLFTINVQQQTCKVCIAF